MHEASKISAAKYGKKSLRDELDSSSLTVFLSYLLSFILCSIVAINSSGSELTIYLCFTISILISGTVHFWSNRYQKDVIRHLEADINILKATLSSDSDYFLILNNKGIALHDERIKTTSKSKDSSKLSKIEQLLTIADVPNNYQTELKAEIISQNLINWNKNNAKVYPYNSNKALVLKKIDNHYSPASNSLIFIKALTIPAETLEHQLDELNISFYELDNQGFIISCSKYFAKSLGYRKEQLTASLTSYIELINLEGSIDQTTAPSKEITNILGNWQGFLKLKTKYNESTPFFVLHKSSLDSYGRVEKIIGYAIRIFDASVMHNSLDAKYGWLEYSWKCFFQDSPYPVAIITKQGDINRANLSFKAYLPDSQDLTNIKFSDLFNAADRPLINTEFKKIFESNFLPKPLKNIKLDNSDKLFDVYMGKITNLKGEATSLMVRITDVTAQKELHDNLSHAQRMQTIGQLVGSVAHDFNNLLTAISGFCDLLFLRHSVGDPSFAYIMQVRQNSDRAANLVKRLLAFSRKQTLQLSIINLSQLFSDFTTLIKRLIGSDIKLEMNIAHDLWPVKIDPVQMEQVVLNLVVNAHQAIEKDGMLKIDLRNETIKNPSIFLDGYFTPDNNNLPSPGDYIAIEVIDNGCGISSSVLCKMYEPFFTTKAEKSGTGLGLSTVYGIITQSEGYIYVKSELGVGTRFLILLKRQFIEKTKKQSVEQIVTTHSPNTNSLSKGCIALIEDEESVRIFTKNVLLSRGYEVIEYPSAVKALENLNHFIDKADLIISDVVMPEMTGPALITEIKKIKPSTKVIFVSGYAEEAFNEEYGSNRNFHFLPKPFSLKQLTEMVNTVLLEK